MGSWYLPRRGLSCAAALALVLSACGPDGNDGIPQRSAAAARPAASSDAASAATLASVHRDLPLPPDTDEAQLNVVVTHPGGARAPGLDAAVAILRQRPDLRIEVVVPADGDPGTTTTMSGDPARVVSGTVVDAVESALDEDEIDLVVIGIDVAGNAQGALASTAARHAVSRGVPALQVSAEQADGVDYGAATTQLLEVLDYSLGDIVDARPLARRLTVPSCRQGMLRGLVDVGTSTDDAPPEASSDCLTDEPPASAGEDELFAAGYATLAQLMP